MKNLIIPILTLVVALLVPCYADFIIEEALIQKELLELIDDTEDYEIHRVASQPEKGFSWPYLVLISKKLEKENLATIYVETVNTGFSSNSYRFHEERAFSIIRTLFYNLKEFEEKLVFITPVFLRPRDNRKLYTHALDRDCMLIDSPKFKRLDLQVLRMVKHAENHLLPEFNIKTKEKFAIGGFSASGEFAQRFSFLHPNKLSFVIAGGIGGLPLLPIESKNEKKLRYPIGISDFEALTGNPFDKENLFKLPRFLYYGSNDTNDPVKYDDAYDLEDRKVVFELFGEDPSKRWLECIKIYDQFETNSETFVDYGMGHRTSKEMAQKIKEFISKQLL